MNQVVVFTHVHINIKQGEKRREKERAERGQEIADVKRLLCHLFVCMCVFSASTGQ